MLLNSLFYKRELLLPVLKEIGVQMCITCPNWITFSPWIEPNQELSENFPFWLVKGSLRIQYDSVSFIDNTVLHQSMTLWVHDKGMSFASMISSILTNTLSIKSNVKRADCRTWGKTKPQVVMSITFSDSDQCKQLIQFFSTV